MKMNKLKDFTKKYGFYLAVGFISVGAITTVIVNSNKDGRIAQQGNPYAQSEEVIGRTVDDVDPMDSVPVDSMNDEKVGVISNEGSTSQTVEAPKDAVTPNKEVTVAGDEITAETFNSTTAQGQDTPFFAQGDTLLLPVEGKMVVPYTDDNTKHWYSDALEETMRTYGITVSAKPGDAIKAPATAKVIDIVDNSEAYAATKYVGNVGQLIVMDLGNGYTCEIGVQGGKASKDLLGQVVLAGEEIGIAGEGTGPFAGVEGSVYVQLQHDGVYVDPTEMFAFNE